MFLGWRDDKKAKEFVLERLVKISGACRCEVISVIRFAIAARGVQRPTQLRLASSAHYTRSFHHLLLAVNGTLPVDFPPLQSPLLYSRHCHGLNEVGRSRSMQPRGRSVRLSSGLPAERIVPFFLRLVFALSGGTSFPGRRFCGQGAFGSSLKGIPPKRPLKLLCHQNTLNRLERTRTPLPPLTCR